MPVSNADSFQNLTINSDLAATRQVEQHLLTQLRAHNYPEDFLFAIRLALEEALSNAIKHGNGLDPAKVVTVRFAISTQEVQLIVTDQGRGFDPNAVPDPTTNEHLEDPNGRGIMLMRAYMDEVSYNSEGNEVRMLKRIRPSRSKQAS